MDFRSFLETLSYRGTGVLLWTEDKEGNIRVLLSRRRMPSLLGDAFSVAIPTGDRGTEERKEDAAVRVVHDELGLNIGKDEINEFYSATAGGVSITVFACHVKSMLKAKDGRGYTDSMWYVLPEDCTVPDADNLTIAELKAFRCTQQNQKVS